MLTYSNSIIILLLDFLELIYLKTTINYYINIAHVVHLQSGPDYGITKDIN